MFLVESEQQSLLAASRNSHWDKLYLLVLLALTTAKQTLANGLSSAFSYHRLIVVFQAKSMN